MGAEHFKRVLGSCNLKPVEGWAGGSSKKQMWLHQTHSVPNSHPPGAWDSSSQEEPEVRGSSPSLRASSEGSRGQGMRLGSSQRTWEMGRTVLLQVLKGGIPTKWEISPRVGSHQHPRAPPLCLRGWAVLGSCTGFLPFQHLCCSWEHAFPLQW